MELQLHVAKPKPSVFSSVIKNSNFFILCLGMASLFLSPTIISYLMYKISSVMIFIFHHYISRINVLRLRNLGMMNLLGNTIIHQCNIINAIN